MPYASTSELPAYVKKLPDTKQRQWMHVFNSCNSDGKSDSTCFAMANGVVGRKKDTDEEAEAGFQWEAPDEHETITDDAVLDLIETVYGDPAEFGDDFYATTPDGEEALTEAAKMRRARMPASSFAYVDSNGGKHLPIHDAAHVRNALARFNQTHFESSAKRAAAKRKILAAAKRYGIEASSGKEASLVDTFTTDVASPKTGLLDRVLAGFGLRPTPLPVTGPFSGGEALLITKQADGRLRWFARYSNAWEDRDREIATEEAHKEFVSWLDTQPKENYPELWLWHTPGTKFGTTDWVDFSDGFAHASGLIDDTDQASVVVEALSKQVGAGQLGVSHGMLCAQAGKYITKYRTFEFSVLPLQRAAVWTTDFNLVGKDTDTMAFTDEKRKWLVDVMGDEALVKQLEGSTEAVGKQLKEMGVEYKESEAPSGVADTLKPLVSQIADMTNAVKAITDVVSVLQKDVTELKKPADDKIADEFFARIAKAAGSRPTENDDNIVKEKEQEAPTDFLTDIVTKQLGLGTTSGAAGVGAPAVGSVVIQ